MDEIKALLDKATALAKEGKIEESRALREQAAELRQIKEEEVKSVTALKPPPVDTSNRLPFGTAAVAAATDVAEPSTYSTAVKSIYIKKYGEIPTATEQVLRELYADTGIKNVNDYYTLREVKYRDFTRYCKTGDFDPRLKTLMLYTPEQVIHGIIAGVPVEEGGYNFKATMVEAQQQLGGYLVPEDFRLEIVQRLPGLTIVRPLARKFNTVRDQVKFLVRRGGNKRYIGNIRSTQTDESPVAGVAETNALWGEIDIPVHVNLADALVSKSLFEDSGLDMMNEVLMPEFSSQAALKEDEQFLVGTGVKEPQGILSGTAANGAPFNTDVAVTNSGLASTIAFDPFVTIPYSLAGQYRTRNKPSVVFGFTSATAAVLAKLKSSTGEYLWTEMYGNNAVSAPETLRGFKVMESEALPEIAANTYPVIFGDLEGYRIVDRVGMSVQRYDDSATAATDSVVFYLRRRYGGQLAEGYRMAAMKCSV